MVALFLSFVLALALLAFWLKDKRHKIPKKLEHKHRAVFFGVGLLAVALFGIGVVQLTRSSKTVNSDKTAIEASKNSNVNESGPVVYKVIGDKKTGESLRVTVITPETSDSRIIKINDEVFMKYKGKAKNVFIDYFDDTTIAGYYFTKISDPKLSAQDKKNLVSHYKALMMATSQSGNKLYKITGGNVVLKSY